MVDVPLQHAPSDYIGGSFLGIEGDGIVSTNPARPGEVVWQGTARMEHVDRAVAAAREAAPGWAALSMDERATYLRRWQDVTRHRADDVAALITAEMGKIHAEALFEARALAGKVDITLDEISTARVRDYSVTVSETREGVCRFKPHGVMAVIGPFNFPVHLPNGHFVPALLVGDTVIVKPSEKTPAMGQLLAEMMHDVGLPPGVFNVVQGDGAIAAALTTHEDIDGILFTGSWPVGRRILEANLDRPGRIIALEMGGNNASVVLDDADLKPAVIECVRASFATTGQRCTCTRRIILQRGIADCFIRAFCKTASTLLVGPGDGAEPVFMGPLVTEQAVEDVLVHQQRLHDTGGRVLIEAVRAGREGHFITPGVIEVDRFILESDCEVFGPLVQVAVVDDLDDAIEQAGATHFGLAASIFTKSEASFERFFRECRSGCINWNTGTAGASGKLPFGGHGHSGNHRPAGAFSVDYCAYPVANMIERGREIAVPAGLEWRDAWLADA